MKRTLALVVPTLVLSAIALAGCTAAPASQSKDEACGIVEEQWQSMKDTGAKVTSPDDAGMLKDNWASIADGLADVTIGEEFFDDAVSSASDRARDIPDTIDGIVEGRDDAADNYAEAVRAFGTEVAKLKVDCQLDF